MAGLTITGHRGAMGVEPENTMRSFRRAVAEGCGEVELDLRLSADGVMVLSHDASLLRTHGRELLVGDLTLAELRALGPESDTRVATLAEVAGEIKLRVQAEVKDPRVVPGLVEMLEADAAFAERTTVTSFQDAALAEVGRLRPGTPMGLIPAKAAEPGELLERAEAVAAGTLMCGIGWLTARHVEEFHAAGLQVTAWPVQDMEGLRRAVGLGVDGVTTDNPHLLDPAALAG